MNLRGKKAVLVLTVMLIMVSSIHSQQQYDNENDFNVEIINAGKSIRITGYSGTKTEARIPPKIQNLPVTEIGQGALWDKQLTDVDIPGSLTVIEFGAFAGNRLSSIVIPAGVTFIESQAFANNQLVSVTIGANVALEPKDFVFDVGFDDFYKKIGSKAGTYLLSWNLQ